MYSKTVKTTRFSDSEGRAMPDKDIIKPEKKNTAAIIAVFILTVLFAPSAFGGGLLSMSFFTLILSGAGAAWLFYTSGYFMGVLAVILAYALSLFLTHDPVMSLSVLTVAPIGICLSLASRKKVRYFSAVVISSFLVFLIVMALLVCPVLMKTGTFGLNAVKETYSEYFDLMRTALDDSFKIVIAGDEVSIISDSNRETYIDLIITVLPGAISALITAVCFGAGAAYRFLLGTRNTVFRSPAERKYILSPISSGVFIVSLLTVMFAGIGGVFGISAANVFLILLPVFFFVGVSTVKEPKIVNGIPMPRLLRPALMLISLFIGIVAVFLTPSFFALYDSIASCIPKPAKK